MTRTIILAMFLLCAHFALAQQTTVVRGKILNADDSTAVVAATVMTLGGRPNTSTNQKGEFTLSGVTRSTKEIQCVMLGFRTLNIQIDIKSTTLNLGTIFMVEENNEIDAVEVKSEAPISIQKGDTTQFNAAAFKTNPDADADDLLMKMPGIVIQNGKVEAQGEPVRKIYVDGKLFFGTDPMAALKNLPADAIESIQLFDEQSEQARLTGFEDGETNKAINIVTKSKTRKSTIVKMEASGGMDTRPPLQSRYLGGGNVSFFGENNRLTITGLSNNVNTQKFGQNEIGGDERIDSNGNLAGQPTGLKTINGFGLNFTRDVKKMKFSSSYFFDNDKNESQRVSRTEYYAQTGKFDSKSIEDYRSTISQSYNNRMNFRLELKLNDKNTFILSPNIRIQKNSTDWLDHGSLTIQNGDSVNRVSRDNPNSTFSYSMAGEALYVRRFEKRGRSVSASVQYSMSDRNSETYQRELQRSSYNKNDHQWIDTKPEKLQNKLVDNGVNSNQLKLKVSYVEPFAKYHRVSLNYIMSRDWGGTNKQSNKYDYTELDYINTELNQCSRFDRNYNSIGFGAGYAFNQKNYTLNAGVDYLRLNQERDEFQPNITNTTVSFNDFQPNFSFKYSLAKSKYIRVQYRGRTELPRIELMQNVIDESSTMNIRIGNPDLKEGYRHSLTAFYNSTNTKKSTNLTLTLSASTISNFIAPSTESTPIDRDTIIWASVADKNNPSSEGYTPARGAFITRQVNLDGYFNTRASATYSFPFRAIKSNVNVGVDYNFIRTPSIYGELNYANINSGGFKLGLTSNISENIDFNIYSTTTFNVTNNTSKANRSFFNENLYLSTNIIFLKSFVFNTLATWRYYASSVASEGSSSYYLLNVGIGKKVFHKNNGEFRITAYDLLNQNKNILHYVRDNSVEDVRTNTMGRYFLARFSYRFNSMSNNQQRKKAISDGAGPQNMNVKDTKKIKSGK